MEEYIRLKEEKSHWRGKVYNWKTATYGKIWCDEDVQGLRSVETESSAILYNDVLISEVALSCEPTVSPLNNNQIDFRILFDKSVDENYTVIYDKNSFSYKIIFVDDLKTDSENDNDKVNMPSFPSSEPTVSYFDDFDYFKDFEKEFLAIAYNDALTSKLDFSPQPTKRELLEAQALYNSVVNWNFLDNTTSKCGWSLKSSMRVRYVYEEYRFEDAKRHTEGVTHRLRSESEKQKYATELVKVPADSILKVKDEMRL
nr:hypothetical protein [Tanacetum cinerariifolium]